MKSEDEILKCGRSLPELVENDSNAGLTFPTANEICGVVILSVFSRSEEKNLRLRNELNFS